MKKSTFLTAIFFIVFPFLVSGQYSLTHYVPASPWQYYNDANELIVTTTSATPVTITIQKSDGTLITNTVTSVVNVPLRYRFATKGVRANFTNTIYTNQGLIVSSTVPIGVQVRNIESHFDGGDYYTNLTFSIKNNLNYNISDVRVLIIALDYSGVIVDSFEGVRHRFI